MQDATPPPRPAADLEHEPNAATDNTTDDSTAAPTSTAVVPSTPAATGITLTAAKVISEVLAPSVVIVLLSIAMSSRSNNFRIAPTVVWALVVAVFSAGIPMAFIAHGARRKKWDGHHVRNREGRLLPLLVCFASTAVGLLIMWVGGAPRAMIVMAVAMLATLVVTGAITTKWKISLHTAVSAGGVIMLAFVYDPLALLGLILVAVIGWSRVVVQHHSTAQVTAGALAGALVAAATFLIGT